MADESNQSQTEAPTPRRREDARKKGQVASSPDLSSGALLLAGLLVLWIGGATIGDTALQSTASDLRSIGSVQLDRAELPRLAWSLLVRFISMAGAVVGTLFVVTLATGVLQAGFRITFQPLQPNWERLSVTRGWSKLMSQRSLARGVTTLLKLTVIGLIASWALHSHKDQIAMAGNGSLLAAASAAWTTAMKAGIAVALGLVIVGLIDYVFQRWKHEQDLRMSRREIQDEHRRDEGDPHTKSRQKRLRREALEQRMLLEVPSATVVVTNPTHFAVALKYDRQTMNAPRVIAKGKNQLARRIMKLARQHQVPVLERKPLARALYKSVKISQEIPAEFYNAIAEIMAFVLGLRRVG